MKQLEESQRHYKKKSKGIEDLEKDVVATVGLVKAA